MPRPNPARFVGGETNLAERIRRELDRRDWTPAHLAELMTASGCAIGKPAIYKILNKENPRGISVDEFVTLATVFETTPEDLLTPVEALDTARAKEILSELSGSMARMEAERRRYGAALDELAGMKDSAPEFYEYVIRQHYARDIDPDGSNPENLGIYAMAFEARAAKYPKGEAEQ